MHHGDHKIHDSMIKSYKYPPNDHRPAKQIHLPRNHLPQKFKRNSFKTPPETPKNYY